MFPPWLFVNCLWGACFAGEFGVFLQKEGSSAVNRDRWHFATHSMPCRSRVGVSHYYLECSVEGPPLIFYWPRPVGGGLLCVCTSSTANDHGARERPMAFFAVVVLPPAPVRVVSHEVVRLVLITVFYTILFFIFYFFYFLFAF